MRFADIRQFGEWRRNRKDTSMRKFLALGIAALLSACSPEPDMQMQYRQRLKADAVPVTDGTLVTVERIGVFKDDLAYQERRGVYVIRDNATGREFIGVSGIGITEVGTHSQPLGKIVIQKQDER